MNGSFEAQLSFRGKLAVTLPECIQPPSPRWSQSPQTLIFLDFQPTQDESFKRLFLIRISEVSKRLLYGFPSLKSRRIQVVTVLSLQVGGFPTRAQHQWIHHLRQGAFVEFSALGNGCYLRSPEGTTPRDENWKTIGGFWGRIGRILEKSLGEMIHDPTIWWFMYPEKVKHRHSFWFGSS